MEVSIYAKANFSGNPKGNGIAAAIIECISSSGNIHRKIVKAEVKDSTKNALLLAVVIAALRTLIKPCKAAIYIDCDYIASAHHQGWVKRWQQNEWRKSNGKALANLKEWQLLYALTEIHKVKFEKYNPKYDSQLDENLIEQKTYTERTFVVKVLEEDLDQQFKDDLEAYIREAIADALGLDTDVSFIVKEVDNDK